MGVHIQVRDVPDAVFLALKARAAGSGRTLSEFLRDLLAEAVAAPATVVAPRGPERPVVCSD
jgi:plasmid stability protein